MQVVPITFLGKEYDLCYSVGVMMRMEDENLDMNTNRGSVTLLSAMMEAGDRLAKLEGKPGKGFLTVDEIADRAGRDDLEAAGTQMIEALTGQRKVETADDPKNAGPTPPAA